MLRTLYTKTMRDQRRGLLGWSIGTALTVFIMAAIWPSFSEMDLTSMLAQYPEAMKEAFNITSMTTGAGYMNAELFSLMLPAIFIIFAVARGARLIAGEERSARSTCSRRCRSRDGASSWRRARRWRPTSPCWRSCCSCRS